MEEFLERFLQYCNFELNLSKNTISAYKTDLSNFFGFLLKNNVNSPDLITNDNVEEYCIFLEKNKISARSIQRKISSINSLMKFLYEEGVISHNPITDIQKPKIAKKIPHFLNDFEIERLIKIALEQNSPDGIRNACIISILFASGMRVSELVNLPLSAIKSTCSNEKAINSINVIGKGNKERIVPISKQAEEMLQKYLAIRHEFLVEKKNGKWLFPSRKGANISRVFVGLMLKNLAKMANIDEYKVHPHSFRHSIAIKLLSKGMNIRDVQEILGHSDIATTAIYTHINPREIVNFVNEFHPFNE